MLSSFIKLFQLQGLDFDFGDLWAKESDLFCALGLDLYFKIPSCDF